MGHVLRIEKWAENLDEITLSRWLREPGDTLEEGDPLCELISEKATFDYEMEFPATLLRQYAAEHSVLPIGYALAFVGNPGEEPPAGIEAENERLLAAHQAALAEDLDLDLDLPVARPAAPTGTVRATPAARRVAREAAVKLEDVAAWLGQDKTIEEGDVKGYLEARPNG
jgi:pyruvate/2-oxoglutarate dehydrogenase complex dihydrolipoamide acyltransferase (E2) component